MWRAIDNSRRREKSSLMPSPFFVEGGIYLLFDNEEIAGKSALTIRTDAVRKSVADAVRAGEAYLNRRSAEIHPTEGGVIDMYANTITESRPVPRLLG